METAIHLSDLVRAADADCITALILLGLSSAFTTVNHSVMLTVLQQRFGIDGQAPEWLTSYLAADCLVCSHSMNQNSTNVAQSAICDTSCSR